MATIIIGSARHDENGKYIGGAAGDQLQTSSTNDKAGEVSMQNMYTHSKGWYIFRPKSVTHANAIAAKMKAACNNSNIGYDQNQRLGIITYGISTTTKTECDCSSLVRECIKEATGTDPGNFTTSTEAKLLAATGLFEDKIAYVSQSKTPVYNGDVLCTKVSGHTAIIVSGNARSSSTSTTTTTTSSSSTTKKATDAAKSGPSSSVKGTYTVTASSLNVRNGAGTGKSIMVTIPKGTAVQCYGYYTTVSGVKWLYIQFTYKNVIYTGFACSSYLKKS